MAALFFQVYRPNTLELISTPFQPDFQKINETQPFLSKSTSTSQIKPPPCLGWMAAITPWRSQLLPVLLYCLFPLRSLLKPKSGHIPTLVKNHLYLLISPRVKSYAALPAMVPSYLLGLFSIAPPCIFPSSLACLLAFLQQAWCVSASRALHLLLRLPRILFL